MPAKLSAYEEVRQYLAHELMNVGAILTTDSDHPLVVERENASVKERGFKLKLHERRPSAPLSPFYLNLRTPDNPKAGPLSGSLVDLVARCMWRLVLDTHLRNGSRIVFDAVAGIPNAGNPFAEAFARISGVPCLFLEKRVVSRARDAMSLVSQVPKEVRKVLLIDDVVSSADSKLEAIYALRSRGLEANDALVVIDREEGAHERLVAWDCLLYSVFTLDELLTFYVSEGRMDFKTELEIRAYHEQVA